MDDYIINLVPTYLTRSRCYHSLNMMTTSSCQALLFYRPINTYVVNHGNTAAQMQHYTVTINVHAAWSRAHPQKRQAASS